MCAFRLYSEYSLRKRDTERGERERERERERETDRQTDRQTDIQTYLLYGGLLVIASL